MPSTVTAIVGANFGDEGKGLMTDWFAAQDPARTLVVRANGGAQAGHTVVTPQGRRHVFSHVGSGAMSGAPTLLSRFFVSNPLLLDKEWPDLAELAPRLLVDPRSLVTTPFDMLINQLVERVRGGGRHGSCGLGFNETIERSLQAEFRLEAGALDDPDHLRHLLEDIRWDHVPRRLDALGVAPDARFRELLGSRALQAAFLAACARFRQRSKSLPDTEAMHRFDHVLFEGAQGLLLDEAHPWFPHVTRSKTGLHNVATLMRAGGLAALRAVYVTRWYLTRHGAGPFPTEVAERPAPAITDSTNIPNDWQGSLRFGLLDLEGLARALRQDLAQPLGVAVDPCLALTCLDQALEQVPWRPSSALPEERTDLALFPDVVRTGTGLDVRYLASGPTRITVRTNTDGLSLAPLAGLEPARVHPGNRRYPAAMVKSRAHLAPSW